MEEESFRPYTPGDINLLSVTIHKTAEDAGIGIAKFMFELEIFEDINSPFVRATMVVTDSIMLSSILPIVGGEIVRIAYRTPYLPEEQTSLKNFVVYRLDAKTMQGAKTTYFLQMVSEAGWVDSFLKLSKVHTGKPHSIIENILKEDLGITAFFPPVDIESFAKFDPKDVTYISPINCTPLEAIKNISAMTEDNRQDLGGYKQNGMFFYETMKGFFLRSYWDFTGFEDENLTERLNELTTAERLNTFIYDSNPMRSEVPGSSRSEPDTLSIMQMVENLIIIKQFDVMLESAAGMLNSKVHSFDVTTKTLKTYSYDYFNQTEGQKLLTINAFPMHRSLLGGKSKILAHTTFDSSYSEDYEDTSYSRVLTRPINGLLSAVEIDIEIKGRSEFELGSRIFLMVPISADGASRENAYDPLLTGYYVVTCIKHRINEFRHSMILRIVTDSYNRGF